jgi:hypothetical protein
METIYAVTLGPAHHLALAIRGLWMFLLASNGTTGKFIMAMLFYFVWALINLFPVASVVFYFHSLVAAVSVVLSRFNRLHSPMVYGFRSLSFDRTHHLEAATATRRMVRRERERGRETDCKRAFIVIVYRYLGRSRNYNNLCRLWNTAHEHRCLPRESELSVPGMQIWFPILFAVPMLVSFYLFLSFSSPWSDLRLSILFSFSSAFVVWSSTSFWCSRAGRGVLRHNPNRLPTSHGSRSSSLMVWRGDIMTLCLSVLFSVFFFSSFLFFSLSLI